MSASVTNTVRYVKSRWFGVTAILEIRDSVCEVMDSPKQIRPDVSPALTFELRRKEEDTWLTLKVIAPLRWKQIVGWTTGLGAFVGACIKIIGAFH